MGDHRVNLDSSVHVPVDNFRHIGAAASAAKSGASPHPAGHQLERTRGNFLPGAGNADSPAAMTAFERGPHQIYVTDTFESIIRPTDLVGAAFGHIDEMRNEFASDLRRINEMRHAEALSHAFFSGFTST